MEFDPNNSAQVDSGLFALPFSVDDAAIVIVAAPWDASSSQGWQSSTAPDAVYAASKFVELFDPAHGAFYRRGIAMDPTKTDIAALNASAIALQERPDFDPAELTTICERVNEIIRRQVNVHLENGKHVGLLGGDHSVSYGSIEAHLARYPDMGILQIDAHCDLRRAFDGMQYSHASIMYNVLEHLGAPQLVQVGVRGLCDFEAQYVRESPRVRTFFDHDLHRARAGGESWSSVCGRIIDALPDVVYISLDVDGLEPAWCPHTGTPVPGGIGYNDVVYLLNEIKGGGRSIVGFDLVEVGSDPFDAGIAAHLLYQLCALPSGLSLKSVKTADSPISTRCSKSAVSMHEFRGKP